MEGGQAIVFNVRWGPCLIASINWIFLPCYLDHNCPRRSGSFTQGSPVKMRQRAPSCERPSSSGSVHLVHLSQDLDLVHFGLFVHLFPLNHDDDSKRLENSKFAGSLTTDSQSRQSQAVFAESSTSWRGATRGTAWGRTWGKTAPQGRTTTTRALRMWGRPTGGTWAGPPSPSLHKGFVSLKTFPINPSLMNIPLPFQPILLQPVGGLGRRDSVPMVWLHGTLHVHQRGEHFDPFLKFKFDSLILKTHFISLTPLLYCYYVAGEEADQKWSRPLPILEWRPWSQVGNKTYTSQEEGFYLWHDTNLNFSLFNSIFYCSFQLVHIIWSSLGIADF